MSAQPLVNDAAPLAVPPDGTILAGAYRVDGVIATGGMGIVLRATELAAERQVAIKVMTTSAAADPESVARFRREAKTASSLTSKHVVRVVDHGELDSGLPYLVMERLGGTTLVDVMKVRGALPVSEAVDYILQAIHGVAEAHTLGIVHRDLKPANLFLADEGGRSIIKVLDFGASKLTAQSPIDPGDVAGMTVATSLIGSPRYMAPEQIRSALDVDARADVYGLGATLYELLSGKAMFTADTLARIFAQVLWDAPAALSETRDDVPAELAAIVMRCLAKAPDDRFSSVEALAAELAPFVSPHVMSTVPAPAAPRLRSAESAHDTERPAAVAAATSAVVRTSARASRRPLSAAQADVVVRSSPQATQKMTRVRRSSEAPRRTTKLAAFMLAARVDPAVTPTTAVASARAPQARTQRMARFTPSDVVTPERAKRAVPLVTLAALGGSLVVVLALVAWLLATHSHG